MVTIKNKYILLAAGFWLMGIVLLLLGAYFKNKQELEVSGPLLSIGFVAQAIGFGFFGYVLMQAVLKKK